MKKKENQRVKLTRRLLKDSIVELMHTKPINKITIKEICENAEINRSTFYLYYTDQYALLSEIEDELLQQAIKHLEKISTETDSVSYLQILLEYIQENADIFKTLLCQPDNRSFQQKFVAISFQNLKQNLSQNFSESEKVSNYINSYLVMGSLNVIQRWIESGFNTSAAELALLLFNLCKNAAAVYA